MEVFLCGSTYQCYQLISLGQLLAAVVFSLITLCQYANKLPRLLVISNVRGGGIQEKLTGMMKISLMLGRVRLADVI